MEKTYKTLDANEAVSEIAYRLSEVIAIYPITPSSTMGEWADEWAAGGKRNIWGSIPSVVEMQSEAGVAGAIHGALQAGSLATTFTSSQGLLLMIPNMYKIAGELIPTVFHVAARAVATHALSIFGDHSDVMAARATGFAFLCSASVQEALDFALIAQAATLETRIPFLHFFDGFRTSHEISKVELLSEANIRSMINEQFVFEHRTRALSPDHPVLRGSSQNPDVFFQSREAANSHYLNCPGIVQAVMDRFARLTGRDYHLFDYYGSPEADRVIVVMGSGSEAVQETVDYLNQRGEKVGVVRIRLFRPFRVESFLEAFPSTTRAIAVLDRTKEAGSIGEPLYLDCVNAFYEGSVSGKGANKPLPKIVGGRYGLSSKEFTPAMIKSIFENLAQTTPKNHFTVGIKDDVTHTSLEYDSKFSTEADNVTRAIFYGLGSDGTVGANKNSIKIIGEKTPYFVQGYFVYDSRKSGAVTISHLRFGSKPIHSSYLINEANFIGCHQPFFIDRYDILKHAVQEGIFLLNTHFGPEEIWHHLPRHVQKQIVDKKLKFFVIDGYRVAQESGMGKRINTAMQVCFFALSGILSRSEAIQAIKESIRETYSKKGEEVVQKNLEVVDKTLAYLFEVKVPDHFDGVVGPPPLSFGSDPFVCDVIGKIIAGEGDEIPVSALPCDGTYPTGTSKLEKRNIAVEIPVWEPESCIQCGKCSMVCPHSAVRIKVYDPVCLDKKPPSFKFRETTDPEWKGQKYTIQVAPEDCTGCGICVDICPARHKAEPNLKALNMAPQEPLRDQERKNWDFFLSLPELDRRRIKPGVIRQQQVQQPLFEFSGACSGCGETPYIKLVTQLFGDRLVIANATGCSSIFGGNLPTNPWTKNQDKRGPAWANSLFEDNAEFGLGIRVSLNQQQELASALLRKLAPEIGADLVQAIIEAKQENEADIYDQRVRIALLRERIEHLKSEEARRLLTVADTLVKKSVWIVGGDGWAYDIGFGGLDHVLASGQNVNILVLDTEVYSNTGGQMSKSTPRGAIAKFAAGGKMTNKKDLGLMAMTYGSVYVASVVMGARDEHTLRVLLEAEAYDGPSLIIAYSHCIAHGINEMSTAMQHQKMLVTSGQWLLYRFNPARLARGENPLQLDSAAPKATIDQFLSLEGRFKSLSKHDPQAAQEWMANAQRSADIRRHLYEHLASFKKEIDSTKPESKPLLSGK